MELQQPQANVSIANVAPGGAALLPEPAIRRTDKPKRSLNVFNIFFALERVRLLNALPEPVRAPGEDKKK